MSELTSEQEVLVYKTLTHAVASYTHAMDGLAYEADLEGWTEEAQEDHASLKKTRDTYNELRQLFPSPY